MSPTAVACPNCQAKPGQPCTQPTDTGRKPVSWFHMAREADAKQREAEYNAFTEWLYARACGVQQTRCGAE